MSPDAETDGGQLSYRERDVDSTLDEHDHRISRLEKGALVVLGYGIAEGSTLVTELLGFL